MREAQRSSNLAHVCFTSMYLQHLSTDFYHNLCQQYVPKSDFSFSSSSSSSRFYQICEYLQEDLYLAPHYLTRAKACHELLICRLFNSHTTKGLINTTEMMRYYSNKQASVSPEISFSTFMFTSTTKILCKRLTMEPIYRMNSS